MQKFTDFITKKNTKHLISESFIYKYVPVPESKVRAWYGAAYVLEDIMYYVKTFLDKPSNVQQDEDENRWDNLHYQYLREFRPLWWQIVTQVGIHSEYTNNYWKPDSYYGKTPEKENKSLLNNLKRFEEIITSYFNSDDFVAYLKKRKYTHNIKYIQKALSILRKIDYTKFWVKTKPEWEQ